MILRQHANASLSGSVRAARWNTRRQRRQGSARVSLNQRHVQRARRWSAPHNHSYAAVFTALCSSAYSSTRRTAANDGDIDSYRSRPD